MKNRNGYSIIIVIMILAASIPILFQHCCRKRDKPRYNVILIVSDALRRDVLGCYGGDARTPNIDWLAQNGTLFTNAYATAPSTMPSSVSMSTGKYSITYTRKINPANSRKKNVEFLFHVSNREIVMGEVLQKEGYHVHLDSENPAAVNSNSWQGFKKFREKQEMTTEEIARVEKQTGIKTIGTHKDKRFDSNYHRMYDMLHYLATVSRKQPFFIMKWFMDPHGPYNPPKKFFNRINMDDTKLQQNKEYYISMFKKKIKPRHFNKYEFEYFKALYKAEVESVDERIGYLLKILRHRGILKNTYIIFTADHGEFFGEHRGWGHGKYFFEELVHIPLIVTGPGIPKRETVTATVSHLDLVPTMMDLLNIGQKHALQGKSYAPVFSGKTIENHIIYFDLSSNRNYRSGHRDGMVMGNFKLITPINKGHKNLLYNLKDDPAESNNIIENHSSMSSQMMRLIIKIRKENKNWVKYNQKQIKTSGTEMDQKLNKTQKILENLGYIESQ